ncbi:MAG TPA: D-alanine--D-alanine ligase [Gammaproteobacteria bacterium]
MKRYRILLMVHEDLVPPEDVTGLDEAELDRIRTERDVLETLRALGHDVRVVGIGDRLTELGATIAEWKPHVVFNLLNEFSGIASYDYYVVAHLELMRQPYTGCNPRGMMMSRDKVLTKQMLAWHRIATPAFRLFPYGTRFTEPRRVTFPLIVKSATEEASLGISQASIVGDVKSLKERVQFIHEQLETDAIAEEYVEGRELYVGVLGNTRLTALPVWEMDFGTLPKVQTGIATRKVKWDKKYQAKHGIATGPAKDLPPEEQARLGRLAKRVYRALHMSGFARMDLRMREDGAVFVIEANANPELAKGEDLAASAEAVGIDYPALIARIVSLGLAYMPEWRMFS